MDMLYKSAVAADLGLAAEGDKLNEELEKQKRLQLQQRMGKSPQGLSPAAMDLGMTNA